MGPILPVRVVPWQHDHARGSGGAADDGSGGRGGSADPARSARRGAPDRGPGRRAGAARAADGWHGDPRPRTGLAGPDAAGRGRSRLRDPVRATGVPSTSSWPPRATRRQAPQRPVRGQAGVFRGRAAQSAGRRARGQPRDVSPVRVRRSAGGVEPDAAAGRAAPVEAAGRQDQPQGRPRRPRPARRAPARQGRRRARCASRARLDQCPADPVVHVERLGLVADRDRQPRHAGPVPCGRAQPRGSRPEQRPGHPVRPEDPDREPADGHQRRAEVDEVALCAPGSASGPTWYQEPEEMGHGG